MAGFNFVETKKGYEKDMVTGFIKLNGITVGAVANATVMHDENGNRTEEFEAALKDAMALNIPCVIDCLIDREDKVFPMVSPGAAISEAFDRKDLDRMNSEK